MSFDYAPWPLPANVQAGWSTRLSGYSAAPFNAFNVAHHVGECRATVQSNRALLQKRIMQQPNIVWLNQTHSINVTLAERANSTVPTDASITTQTGLACCVMTADCLPVYFWTKGGGTVGVAHAGWRGLANGILSKTLASFAEPAHVVCGLGPCIGPNAFEVGDEVKRAFANLPGYESCFVASHNQGKYLADLPRLAELQLKQLGVAQVYRSDLCTVALADRFYSYRREGQTGRMANLIWKIG